MIIYIKLIEAKDRAQEENIRTASVKKKSGMLKHSMKAIL